jgi:hypothetical protein
MVNNYKLTFERGDDYHILTNIINKVPIYSYYGSFYNYSNCILDFYFYIDFSTKEYLIYDQNLDLDPMYMPIYKKYIPAYKRRIKKI